MSQHEERLRGIASALRTGDVSTGAAVTETLREIDSVLARLRECVVSQTRELNFAQSLLDTLPVIVVLLDADARVVMFNRFMERTSGYSLADVRGVDWFDTFLPERDRARIRALFGSASGGEQVVGNTNPIVTKSGAEREIEWFATVVRDGRGEITGVLSTGRDITEQLAFEARFQGLFRAVIDPIVGCDETGLVLACNPAVETVFGWSSEELLGENVSILMAEPYRTEHDAYIERYLRTDEKKAIGMVRKVTGRRKNGEEFAAEISISEVSEGSQPRFVGVVRDISEREDMIAKLSHTERLAAVGELAAGVAHEVNNPVNTIINCAQLIQDGDTDPDLCQHIIQEGGRIVSIVRGLLDFARKKDDEFHAVDLAEVATHALSLIRRRLEKSGIDVSVDSPDDLPEVRGRFQQLEQVVLNLLLNANDALLSVDRRPKTIHVRVSRSCDADGREQVCLAVRDNGPGIPQHHRDKIFEPFFTTKRGSGGTGLGLSISHGIVESHGGRIVADSEPGRYTEIRVCLPVVVQTPEG